MLSISQTLLNFSKPSDQDYVAIQYGVLFDTGDYAQFVIAGSDQALTDNAQANGKQTWDEQDIADVYGLTLTTDTVARLSLHADSFQSVQLSKGISHQVTP